MKIVVVDSHTLNPGDLSWEQLQALGQCEIYDQTAADQTIERCRQAQVVITNKVVFDRRTMDALAQLKYIGVTATGYNVVDIATAAEKGIVVTNVPVYGTLSVAQMVFALLLELTQNVGHHSRTVRQGRWTGCKDFCYWDYPLVELADLTMGVVGFGQIGKATARLAKAFGMRVLAYDVQPGQLEGEDVESADLDRLFAASDVITLHCPLTDGTRGLVHAGRIAQMKQTAFLINTSRGPIVVEKDLADALNAGRIAGAGLDVLSVEPPKADNPILTAKNCIITPHIAWATRSSRNRLMTETVENVRAFLAGGRRNVVN
ncbi:MAG: D-2-hydroxyacid dehydrogenase [Planctomycetes bacterium]|nr:D-2-hydroxyacid dehydrogenase [Planctomycetota bacterium]